MYCVIKFCTFLLLLYTLAQWHSGRVLDLQSLGHGFDSHRRQLHSNLGQVVHNYVPLSPSSIPWYWSKDGDVLWLGS